MEHNTQVFFYVLNEATGQKSLHFACQLIEKAYAEQKRIYVHMNSQEEADRFDALLWTYRDDSFLPHSIYCATEDYPPPIAIGFGEVSTHYQDMLVNLAKGIPSFYKQFNQVVEIVFADPVVQQLARERYKQYRDQACDIKTHKLKANEL